VAGRKVAYGRIDPELSRSLFIRRALVEGDWDTRHGFFAANRRLLDEVEELEHKSRRRDIVISDQALYDLQRRAHPRRRSLGRALRPLVEGGATPVAGAAGAAPRGRRHGRGLAFDRRALPEAWRQGDLTLRLSYVFDPGSERDGVTVHVPLRVLPQLEPTASTGSCGVAPELVTR
jgi:ATP-dependent helicase HrpA